MISPTHILRLVENEDYARLADRLLNNGRCHSPHAVAALRRGEAAAPAAIGLALQRLCELAYWPHPDGGHLAQRLVRMQRRDGLFADERGARGREQVAAEALLAPTAVALRGLIDWAAEFPDNDDRIAIIRRAIQRAWCALSAAFVATTLDGLAWDDIAWAVVLWQLGDADEARQRLPIASIRKRLSRESPVQQDDLTRLALIAA